MTRLLLMALEVFQSTEPVPASWMFTNKILLLVWVAFTGFIPVATKFGLGWPIGTLAALPYLVKAQVRGAVTFVDLTGSRAGRISKIQDASAMMLRGDLQFRATTSLAGHGLGFLEDEVFFQLPLNG